MGDILSQNEIDSLLAALSSGEIDAEEYKDTGEKQIKNYNNKLLYIARAKKSSVFLIFLEFSICVD